MCDKVLVSINPDPAYKVPTGNKETPTDVDANRPSITSRTCLLVTTGTFERSSIAGMEARTGVYFPAFVSGIPWTAGKRGCKRK